MKHTPSIIRLELLGKNNEKTSESMLPEHGDVSIVEDYAEESKFSAEGMCVLNHSLCSSGVPSSC